MAEFGAYLTVKKNSDFKEFNKPSIFEALTADNLANGLKNAFHYLSKVAVQSNPAKYSFYHIYFDEVYLLFDFVVQFVHLYVYKASFAERIYGLRRIDSKQGGLSLKHSLVSLFWLVSFPYLRSKLNTIYEQLSREHFEGKLKKEKRKHAYLFVQVYPTLNALWELNVLLHQITYTVGRGRNHNPLLTLAGVELIVFSPEISRETIESETLLIKMKRLSLLTAKLIAKSFGYGLSFGAFFLQFLDYWYTRETLSPNFTALPLPPPPKKFTSDLANDTCPICLNKRKNETVLTTSGFVFCYSCIHHYIAEYGKCPVSGYYSTQNHLLKLYPPER
ncbi:peroxisome assembly protein 12-like protein [Dinothrombium tinctorium]|uniref:Peroxisome assembly protein 12 n=1 Tax=Dinothrombium tinctorium TaxID=1965070 RepID=A0A3S3SEA6_9ACAR|nr:peroxisome assembly protein 12-like protein [Dinothrombium tinctorium]RWS14105.1 peroxisome assembly protein 12-like protein [Dinothrombium tinctorium]RWS14144.1 peroxisome assembly protein 12-like protein [Dinothrombium tinctorium]